MNASRRPKNWSGESERLASESEPAFNITWIESACEQAGHFSGNLQKADKIIVEVRKVIASAQPEV
jgi:hypothetical protein